eukprot:TRINITY_DN1047_c1_g2_i1.p1 TRINITY_DN1047_c1_g2~~TRINITY_DN1047_c1_g2_i1.p1  ORF type:complete len:451 (+),score=116.20 TRINITY_DN1047_c1_g2_i1:64-1416(+)
MAVISLGAKCLAEFVGTFMLVFTVGCNVLGGSGAWAAVSIASVLMVMIYALGGVSGANFNPAVSVTLGITKTMGGPGFYWDTVGLYIAAQLGAGVLAGLAYSTLFGKAFNLEPAPGFTMFQAGVCELLYTFMLCFVVLNVAVAKKNGTEKGQYFGLSIGYVIIAGAFGAGAISGGCFNPAVALGIDLSSAYLGFGACLFYTILELMGAVLAAITFMAVRPEDFGYPKSTAAPLISEFLGTFILVLTVGLNVLAKSPAAAFSIAASLMCMIYALGDVSGANFNPAVSVALVLTKDLPLAQAMKYIGVQLLGGSVASATYMALYDGKSFPLGPQGDHSWLGVAVAETAFTFVLCFVVLCAAVSRRTKTSDFFGFAIGSCVTVGGLAIGGVSGGSLNPAVSFAIASAHGVKDASVFGNALMYSLFEIGGAALAVGAFKVTHAPLDGELEKLGQ